MARADGSTWEVEWAPGDSPLTPVASCTWVALTDRVRAPFSPQRGSTSELSPVSPGTFTVVCDNRDRELDPTFASGAWFGDLVPMKRIRVTMTIDAITERVVTGYILRYEQGYEGLDQIVTLHCVDAFRVLEQSTSPGTAYEAEVLADDPLGYWRFDRAVADAVATIVGDDVTGEAQPITDFVYPVSAPMSIDVDYPVGAGTAVGDAMWQLVSQLTTAPKSIEAWFVTTATSVTYLHLGASGGWIALDVGKDGPGIVRVGYSNTADNRRYSYAFADLTTALIPPGQAHIALTATSSTITLYVNGHEVWSAALSVGTELDPGGYDFFAVGVDSAVHHAAVYSDTLSSGRIVAHFEAGFTAYGHPMGERAGARIGRILDSIGWPAGDRDLSQGETVLGPWIPGGRSALSQMREVETAEQGLLFLAKDGKITFRDRQWFMTNTRNVTAQATFGESGSELRYKATSIDANESDFIRNIVTVSYAFGDVTVKDQTSIDANTQQSDSVSAPLITSGWLARQLARFRLRLRKDPATRVPRILVNPRAGAGSAVMLPALCALELGDRVIVKRRPFHGGGSAITLTCTVQGIAPTVTKDSISFDLALSPAPPNYTEGPYLTVADATYGDIGVAAGNLVPY